MGTYLCTPTLMCAHSRNGGASHLPLGVPSGTALPGSTESGMLFLGPPSGIWSYGAMTLLPLICTLSATFSPASPPSSLWTFWERHQVLGIKPAFHA